MAQQHKLGTCKTTITTSDGFTRITYVATVVVKFSDKEIVLDSGGWRTRTTLTRMSQAANQFDLKYSVQQINFEWFVHFNGKTIPFSDGMVLAR